MDAKRLELGGDSNALPTWENAEAILLHGIPVDGAEERRRVAATAAGRFDQAKAEPLDGDKRFARGTGYGAFNAGIGRKNSFG